MNHPPPSTAHAPCTARAGLTLTEVMVAMLLFALGMLGFFSMTSQLRSVRDLTERLAQANAIAESTLETMRASGVAGIANGSNTVGRFRQSWTVVTNSGFASKHVEVTVSFRDLRNQPHAVTVNTVIAK